MLVAKGKLLLNYGAKSGGIHTIYKYHKQKQQHWVYMGSSQQVQEVHGKLSPEAFETCLLHTILELVDAEEDITNNFRVNLVTGYFLYITPCHWN